MSIKKLFLGIITALILGSCAGDNSTTTRKTRTESYIDYENKEVTLTYSVENNKMYYQRTAGNPLFNENPRLQAYCTVTNTSGHDGTFEFYATLSSQGSVLQFKSSKYIKAGESVQLSENKVINHYSFDEQTIEVDAWGIIPETKTVIVEVVKYREVEN
ncbi:MAG: hypothetical protein LBN27_13220 [Prevotellaceae bacterium]|jgi:hypothetical protein|nr:hypothetical protein [Prevotellaceae bacterium]